MSEVTTAEAGEAIGERLLDPFTFIKGARSRIAGLGGSLTPPDPDYAFHTDYVEAAPGICHFVVRFRGLAARSGVLQLRVHIIAREPGAIAMMANMERIAFNRLVKNNGEVSIRFEGFRGYTYALMGLVYGQSDASAEELVVALDRPADPNSTVVSSDGRATAFGGDATRPLGLLISTEAPSFGAPVTQLCTRAQVKEPSFRTLRQELALEEVDDLTAWRAGFIINALRRYDMLGEGARGIGFGAPIGRMQAVLEASGAALVPITPSEGATGEADATRVQLDNAIAGAHLDYDFAYSFGMVERLGSRERILRFVEESLACLRPGGLFVHTGLFDLEAIDSRAEAAHGTCGRATVEQLALLAISRKHEVAQFKIGSRDALVSSREGEAVGSFGLIIRRALSSL